jgi:hypothetical protein
MGSTVVAMKENGAPMVVGKKNEKNKMIFRSAVH